MRANWKIVVENFLECYHCGKVHPEYTRVMAGAASSFLSRDEMATQSGRRCTPIGEAGHHQDTKSPRGEGKGSSDSQDEHSGTPIYQEQEQSDFLVSWCLGGETLRGSQPSRLRFRRGACTQSLDGQPVAPLMGTHQDYDGAMVGLWIGWTVEMEANPDHVASFRFTPREVERTDVEVNWLVRGDAVEGNDYDRSRLVEFWKITGEQDWRICEVVQSGVRSRHYTPGPLSEGERFAAAFLREYLERLGAGIAAGPTR